MDVRYDRNFRKQYEKADKKIRSAFTDRLRLFRENRRHPLLHNHLLTGEYQGYRSINVTGDWRALFIEKQSVEGEVMGELGSLYREAKISREEFWREIKEALGLRETMEHLESEWIASYELIEGTEKIIKALAKTYNVYFLSDNVRERVEQLEQKYHFLSLFSGGIFSHEVGVRKPDPRIYQMILDLTRVTPNEAIYIDDKPHFLPPAQELGIATIAFKTPEQLRKDLKMRGIMV
ncbi:HAD-IA family hydrolase [Candidatus Gottesmanbacteria bacterium]|nr:HAD-IA family hydrolase [Candidatus Gottesmanbacteria bacterium]